MSEASFLRPSKIWSATVGVRVYPSPRAFSLREFEHLQPTRRHGGGLPNIAFEEEANDVS